MRGWAVLIRRADLEAIARGEVDLAFRRRKRPTVRTGGSLRTALGVLAIESVERVEEQAVSEREARRAGFASRGALLRELGKRPDGHLYRIALRLAGPDPRRELRRRDSLSDEEAAELSRRLARFDRASPRGPWTATVLRLIRDRPATRAPDLAAAAGFEPRWFKTRVRRLKELGLTESLRVGYRLSPRAEAYLKLRR